MDAEERYELMMSRGYNPYAIFIRWLFIFRFEKFIYKYLPLLSHDITLIVIAFLIVFLYHYLNYKHDYPARTFWTVATILIYFLA